MLDDSFFYYSQHTKPHCLKRQSCQRQKNMDSIWFIFYVYAGKGINIFQNLK